MKDFSMRYPEPKVTSDPRQLLEGWFGLGLIVADAVTVMVMWWFA